MMFQGENKGGMELVEIKSSLGLQVLMYYQAFYSVLFFCISGGCMMNKITNYGFQNAVLELLTLPIFVLWSVTEVARVIVGYVGNVKEKVPMISAFLLLTLFPQLVAVVFFTFLQDPIFPFDKASGYIMLIFLVFELIIGKRSLDSLIEKQTAQFFRLCQEEEIRRIDANRLAQGSGDTAQATSTAAPPQATAPPHHTTVHNPLHSEAKLQDDAPSDREPLLSRSWKSSDAPAPAPYEAPAPRWPVRRRRRSSQGDDEERRGLLSAEGKYDEKDDDGDDDEKKQDHDEVKD